MFMRYLKLAAAALLTLGIFVFGFVMQSKAFHGFHFDYLDRGEYAELYLRGKRGVAELGKKDPFFAELDAVCKKHNNLWNAEAEEMLLKHFA